MDPRVVCDEQASGLAEARRPQTELSARVVPRIGRCHHPVGSTPARHRKVAKLASSRAICSSTDSVLGRRMSDAGVRPVDAFCGRDTHLTAAAQG